jgi:hypothetical protein
MPGSTIRHRESAGDGSLPGVSGINWGDFPTWCAVFVGAVGGTAALIQLRQQGNVLKGEVERNKRRDQLLDGQLSEVQQAERFRQRSQAERVDLTWNSIGPGSYAQVVNDSRRPIRNVRCQIRLRTGDLILADQAGELMPVSREGVSGWAADKDAVVKGWHIAVIRGGGRATFEFRSVKCDPRGSSLMARFTDDAGQDWSLDHDLHLVRLANRDNW